MSNIEQLDAVRAAIELASVAGAALTARAEVSTVSGTDRGGYFLGAARDDGVEGPSLGTAKHARLAGLYMAALAALAAEPQVHR